MKGIKFMLNECDKAYDCVVTYFQDEFWEMISQSLLLFYHDAKFIGNWNNTYREHEPQ